MIKIGIYTAIFLVVIGILIQFIPYNRDHSIPSVNDEPVWPSAEVHDLARRACFDCHSNQTVWPWYGNIAPVSWLLQHDVTEGRKHLNFSDWNRPDHQHTDEFQEVLEKGDMPPAPYLLLHPAARLSTEEHQTLWEGLMKLAETYQHGH